MMSTDWINTRLGCTYLQYSPTILLLIADLNGYCRARITDTSMCPMETSLLKEKCFFGRNMIRDAKFWLERELTRYLDIDKIYPTT